MKYVLTNYFKALIVTILICAISGYLLLLIVDDAAHRTVRSLYFYFNIRVGQWKLFHSVFILSFCLLPFYAWLAWAIRKEARYKLLIQYNATSLGLFTLFLSLPLVYLLITINIDPNAIHSLVESSNLFLCNYILGGANLLSAVFILVHGWTKRNHRGTHPIKKSDIIDTSIIKQKRQEN